MGVGWTAVVLMGGAQRDLILGTLSMQRPGAAVGAWLLAGWLGFGRGPRPRNVDNERACGWAQVGIGRGCCLAGWAVGAEGTRLQSGQWPPWTNTASRAYLVPPHIISVVWQPSAHVYRFLLTARSLPRTNAIHGSGMGCHRAR